MVRQIRPGGRALAIIASFTQTCKKFGIHPWRYLTHLRPVASLLQRRSPHPASILPSSSSISLIAKNRLKTTTPGFPPRGRLRDSPLMGTTSCHTHQTTNPCREPNGPPADICALINHFLIRADDFRQNSQSKIWQKPFFSNGITPEFANY